MGAVTDDSKVWTSVLIVIMLPAHVCVVMVPELANSVLDDQLAFYRKAHSVPLSVFSVRFVCMAVRRL